MKKHISIVLSLIMVASMMFAAAPALTSEAGAPTDAYYNYIKHLKKKGTVKVKWLDGYNTYYISKSLKVKKNKKLKMTYFKYYCITDINGDGTNDLLLARKKNQTGNGKVLVLTYKNGKVVPVFYVKGVRNGVYKGDYNRVVFKMGSAGESNTVVMQLVGKKLVHKVTYSKVKRTTKKGYKYYKDKKKISKAKYKTGMKIVDRKLKFKKI